MGLGGSRRCAQKGRRGAVFKCKEMRSGGCCLESVGRGEKWVALGAVAVVVGSIVPVMPKKSQEIPLRGVPDFDS